MSYGSKVSNSSNRMGFTMTSPHDRPHVPGAIPTLLMLLLVSSDTAFFRPGNCNCRSEIFVGKFFFLPMFSSLMGFHTFCFSYFLFWEQLSFFAEQLEHGRSIHFAGHFSGCFSSATPWGWMDRDVGFWSRRLSEATLHGIAKHEGFLNRSHYCVFC